MDSKRNLTVLIALLTAVLVSGCATCTVAVPVGHHAQKHKYTHVVYQVRPAKRHCWRHNGHWDCR